MEQEEKNKIPILADKFFAEMREQKFSIEEAYTLLDNLKLKIYLACLHDPELRTNYFDDEPLGRLSGTR